ncbi:hypothetical protein M422DRAFT_51901 [Sphaerobolus stellatus SS14]|uniref:BD-FAE-like domain-containing protein n=1 Tax=Sphaerobolus stellatus (strain SS14) TaxID=990650 RepID=A0A0C9VBG6_SPHS4|nr:hypothetical protein M422DRAFT_51901 [Sphaerobolus stellatus SS14]
MAVPHTSNKLFDVYAEPDDISKPLIVYVHGGAWRSESKALHAPLARRLRELTGFPVAVVEYRLSTQENNFIKHPEHAKDVLEDLETLVNWAEAPYDRTRFYLIGHSAGGHLLTSIFLDSNIPSIRPSDALLRAAKGIAIASGLYDLDALLAKFPSYDFVPQAFNTPYEPWNTTTYPLYPGVVDTRWHVIHSSGDTLVDFGQSDAIYEHLGKIYVEKGLDRSLITKDYETLTTGHQYVREPIFAQLVADWLEGIVKK